MTWPYAPSIARGFLLGVVFITHIYTHLKKKIETLTRDHNFHVENG